MTERGVCADCGARYRVPDASRTYPCKKCGGEVMAEAPSLNACEACGADNEPDAAFCEGCGQALGETAERAPVDRMQTAEDARDLRSAKKRLRFVRLVYVLSLIGSALGALGLGAAWSMNEEPILGVLAGAEFLQVLLFAVALSKLDREPYAWTVVLASLKTMSVALSFLFLNLLGVFWSMLFAAALWGSLPALSKVREIQRRNPHLDWTDQRRARTRERHERPKSRYRSGRGETNTKLGVYGGVSAVVVVVLVGIWWTTRPPAPGPVADAWIAAWNDGDVDDLAQFFREQKREILTRTLEYKLEKTRWEEARPTLGTPVEVERRGDVVQYTFAVAEGEFRAAFQLFDEGWHVKSMSFPDPPIVPDYVPSSPTTGGG